MPPAPDDGRAGPGAWPETLIISESPFSLVNGFGVTLTTFFQGWPREKLRQFYTTTPAPVSRDVCQNIRRAHIPIHGARRYGVMFALGLIPEWRHQYSRRWLEAQLKGWRPDLVYSLSHSFTTARYAGWVSEILDCPHLLHIADDCLGRAARAEVQAVCRAAAGRLAISEEMRSVYAARHQLDFDVLHNGAAQEIFDQPPASRSDPAEFVVRYLGSIVPRHHFPALDDIAEAVRRVKPGDRAMRMEIYGGEVTRRASDHIVDGRQVIYGGPADRLEGYRLLASADLLVIPVSFASESYEEIRLSFPTKLPECLASGVPTLVYGPAGSAPVEFCRRHQLASVIPERGPDLLDSFFAKLLIEPDHFRGKAAADREFARQHLSAPAIRERFHRFVAAARQKRGSIESESGRVS